MLVVTGARADAELVPMVPVVGGRRRVGGEPRHRRRPTSTSVAPEAPGRGEELLDSLSTRCSRWPIVVVDNADLDEGQVASVLALDAAADGPGRRTYGYGDGADGVLPGVDAAVTAAPDGAATSVTRSVAGMGAAAAVSRAFGGLRMVVIAAVLGTTYLGNTFQASNSVSNVLFELLAAGALSAVLVPDLRRPLRPRRGPPGRGGGRRRAVDRAASGSGS